MIAELFLLSPLFVGGSGLKQLVQVRGVEEGKEREIIFGWKIFGKGGGSLFCLCNSQMLFSFYLKLQIKKKTIINHHKS